MKFKRLAFAIYSIFICCIWINTEAKVCREPAPCPPTANVHITKSGILKMFGMGVDEGLQSQAVKNLLKEKIEIPEEVNEEIPPACLKEYSKEMGEEKAKKHCFKICEDQEKLKALGNNLKWKFCPISVPALILDNVKENEYADGLQPVPVKFRFPNFRSKNHSFGKTQLRYIDKNTILACVPIDSFEIASDLYLDDLKDGKTKSYIKDFKFSIKKNGAGESSQVCLKVRLGKDNKIAKIEPFEEQEPNHLEALMHSQYQLIPLELLEDEHVIEFYEIVNNDLKKLNKDPLPETNDPQQMRVHIENFKKKFSENRLLNIQMGTLPLGNDFTQEEEDAISGKVIVSYLKHLGRKFTYPRYQTVPEKREHLFDVFNGDQIEEMIAAIEPDQLQEDQLLELYDYLSDQIDEESTLKSFDGYDRRRLADRIAELNPSLKPETNFFFQSYEEVKQFTDEHMGTDEQRIAFFDTNHAKDYPDKKSRAEKLAFMRSNYFHRENEIYEFTEKYMPDLEERGYAEMEAAYLKLSDQVKGSRELDRDEKIALARSLPRVGKQEFLKQYRVPHDLDKIPDSYINQIYANQREKYLLPISTKDMIARTKELYPHLVEEEKLSDDEIEQIGLAIVNLEALPLSKDKDAYIRALEQIRKSDFLKYMQDNREAEKVLNRYYKEVITKDKELKKFSGEKALALFNLANMANQAEFLTGPLVRSQIETVIQEKVAPMVSEAINKQIDQFDVDGYVSEYTALAMNNLDIRVQDEIDMQKHRQSWERLKDQNGKVVNPENDLIPDQIREVSQLIDAIDDIGDLRSLRKQIKKMSENINDSLNQTN